MLFKPLLRTINLTKKLDVSNNGNVLDNMVTKNNLSKQLQRHGSSSTISTYSSLESDSSCITQDQSSFKSANSKFSGLNATISSLMTNDKTQYNSPRYNYEFNNRSNLNATTNKSNTVKKTLVNKPSVKSNMTINSLSSAKTPGKKSPQNICRNQYLQIPKKQAAAIANTTPVRVPLIKITTPSLDDYNIGDLVSGDETDDEDEPNKTIPEWANFELVTRNVVQQSKGFVNFTKLFKGSSENEVDLGEIFTIQRNRFNARTSSARWECPPVWQTEGIKGDESFRDQ